ncbi:uncharacterized protein LOC115664705 [Syzygium oleosum]|uniref:uncharacterized protein LOC115664705 n=1 Tax=Syzygium oleosum TaxID=219896 RepID=UPI0024B9030A|nr:uncharacterized protein LOC115664705 [Syzygium oleosum]XP_056174036.1 uncharacterized protein LOC115664705 [Syzygium oleosum]XP_056174037.1 uncharacterized protein LOC115664705 [Syzygium oleosum]XP_056174038.1 uncharacterized protein LOC115664705 [Syzygium oleosum]
MQGPESDQYAVNFHEEDEDFREKMKELQGYIEMRLHYNATALLASLHCFCNVKGTADCETGVLSGGGGGGIAFHGLPCRIPFLCILQDGAYFFTLTRKFGAAS